MSLFTNVPLKDTIDFICSLIDFTSFIFNRRTLKSLLQIACCDVVFSLYCQTEGVAMGSALGPIMAGFAMAKIESQLREQPPFYARYVDDILCAFSCESDAMKFLQTLNSSSNVLKFTIEKEADNKIPFLDVLIQKSDHGLQFALYKKTTNTGRYLPSDSHSPARYKKAAIRNLIFRAHRICSSPELFEASYREIKAIFIQNGYHPRYIDDIKVQVFHQSRPPEIDKKAVYWQLPYKKVLEKEEAQVCRWINNSLAKSKISTAYSTKKTSSFFPNKDKISSDLHSHLFYEYVCGRCPKRYIGESVRHFTTRRDEHISGQPEMTEVTQHSAIHKVMPENFKIKFRTRYTKTAEAICIKMAKQSDLLNEKQQQIPIMVFLIFL